MIKDFLQKDHTKRTELIDFVTQEYNTMSADDFDALYA